MKQLTEKQQDLLNLVNAAPGLSTWGYADLRGDQQAYCSHLRDRLFRLANRGLIRYFERRKRVGNWSCVIERRWFTCP